MLLVKINSRLCTKHSSVIKCIRNTQSLATTSENEVMESTPVYPPILDMTFKARTRRQRAARHEEIKMVKTVEEKMIKINMPRYWGFKVNMFEEGSVYYNELNLVQYITRTHVIKDPGLPSYYDNLIAPEKLDSLVQKIKTSIEDGIAFELDSRRRDQEKSKDFLDSPRQVHDMISDAVSTQVNRIMMTEFSQDYPHLIDTQIDFDPRVEAFWFCGGIPRTPQADMGMRRAHLHEILDEPTDRGLQYIGRPSLQLRYHFPLNEILPMAECENPDLDVPVCKYDPRTFGHCMKRRHGTSVPGFWPGDSCEFGLMSYNKAGYLHQRIKDWDDEPVALTTHSVISNYAWLLSQACHLGFSTFNDVTYPLVNQMIITDGQKWSFSVYQLNTTLVNGWFCDQNPKRNICWITEPMKLFEKVENEKLVGFNDDVLKHLVKFYINVPQERVGVEMKPYLGEVEKCVADYTDDEKRCWLENRYKHLISMRPRYRIMPEMYLWERVYKHQFKTRPLDKKRTPWDYGKNPFLRRLDEHYGAYIPKAQRPKDKKRIKFAKTYYP